MVVFRRAYGFVVRKCLELLNGGEVGTSFEFAGKLGISQSTVATVLARLYFQHRIDRSPVASVHGYIYGPVGSCSDRIFEYYLRFKVRPQVRKGYQILASERRVYPAGELMVSSGMSRWQYERFKENFLKWNKIRRLYEKGYEEFVWHVDLDPGLVESEIAQLKHQRTITAKMQKGIREEDRVLRMIELVLRGKYGWDGIALEKNVRKPFRGQRRGQEKMIFDQFDGIINFQPLKSIDWPFQIAVEVKSYVIGTTELGEFYSKAKWHMPNAALWMICEGYSEKALDLAAKQNVVLSHISELEREMTRLLEEGRINKNDHEELVARYANLGLAIHSKTPVEVIQTV